MTTEEKLRLSELETKYPAWLREIRSKEGRTAGAESREVELKETATEAAAREANRLKVAESLAVRLGYRKEAAQIFLHGRAALDANGRIIEAAKSA